MIIITGATGALNGATVTHLLERVPAAGIAVVARDPARAQHLAARGVDVRRGDYADPPSLVDAFAGADQLVLVSASDPRADSVALHRSAVEAAVHADVGRVLYTSHQGAAPGTPFRPGRDHAATEQILAASGLPWTSLRNGFYMHSLQWVLGPWRTTGVVTVPAEGAVSWTSRDDSAEAAAAILLADTPFEGPVTLTASSAPTFEEIAEIGSGIIGRPVRVERLDPEDWVRGQVAAGSPEHLARFVLGMYEAAEGGFFAGTEPTLRMLIGREPQTVREYLALG